MYIVYSHVPNICHEVRPLKFNFLFVVLQIVKNDKVMHM